MKKIKGCTHLIIRDGRIAKVVTHLNTMPKNGVVHLNGDRIMSFTEFKKSHPHDHDELKNSWKKVVVSDY